MGPLERGPVEAGDGWAERGCLGSTGTAESANATLALDWVAAYLVADKGYGLVDPFVHSH